MITGLVAWLLLPTAFVLVALGLGLALERIARTQLHAPLLIGAGFSLGVVLSLWAYRLGATGLLAAAIVVLPALAGLTLGARGLRRRLAFGWEWAAFAAAYVLVVAPVVWSGGWTWTGYNFVNDTATQMLLADHLAEEAMAKPVRGELQSASTTTEFVLAYYDTAYPLGAHAFLATLRELVPIHLPALYQPYLGALAGTLALTLAAVARRWQISAIAAAAVGVLAVAANLAYQYVLQGNVKELAMVTALAAAAGVAGELVERRRTGDAAVLGVCLAAGLCVYNLAAAPYVGLLVATALAVLLARRRIDRWLLTRVMPIGAVVGVVCAGPALASMARFNEVASSNFASAGARETDFGHLLGPLRPAQAAGVWLTRDYRVPVEGLFGTLTDILVVVVALAAAVGVATALWRRSAGPLLVLVPLLLTPVLVMPRLSPYADGKILALASIGAVFAAGLGAAVIGARSAVVGLTLAAVLAAGVLGSDALAFHGVKLAPRERMDALKEIGERYAGRGYLLVNEPEEFAKVFMQPSQMNSSTEALTPYQIGLRAPRGFGNQYFDLDEQTLEYLQQFPYIVLRRSPDASRPPANYVVDHTNRFYEVWRREDGRAVREHLPLQGLPGAVGRPACRDVRTMAARARDGDVLVAARRARLLTLDTAGAQRSPGWVTHPYRAGMVITGTPGAARAELQVARPGRYRLWINGSFGRPISAWIDGRRAGEAVGVDNLGQWQEAGITTIARGAHTVELRRGGGRPLPGDGYRGELGPLALQPLTPDTLVTVAPAAAQRLCGGTYDWVELVGRG